jgi:hypothetical protein
VRLFCPSVELRNGSADAFLLSAGVICPDAEAPDSARQAQCPSTEPWNGNVEAFLLGAGAKSLGVGAKILDDGVPHLAQEAVETAAGVPRTDCAAESIGCGR